ncbi:hypothetical protein [Parahaliea maris]|uniref:hypothetical protein n=1 Tax=Parahaliea maris TaxID=2716870 RepID=UPI00164F88D3|nr:hypothetical protein [Parahaliea maris]
MDDYIDYLQDALDLVSAWELPEEQFFDAVRDQAMLIAGVHVDWIGEFPESDHRTALRF